VDLKVGKVHIHHSRKAVVPKTTYTIISLKASKTFKLFKSPNNGRSSSQKYLEELLIYFEKLYPRI